MLVVGGHTRNIGKTALMVDLIRAFPAMRWTAIKITQYGHDVCGDHAESCDCAVPGRAFALDEEVDRSNGTDTSRFLVAGAQRALWLRVRQGHLVEGLPALRTALQDAESVIVESNSIMQFLRPEMYLVVVDPEKLDFKESSRVFLDRADAFVLRRPLPIEMAAVPPVSTRLIREKPCFLQSLGEPLPEPLAEFVKARCLNGSCIPVDWRHFPVDHSEHSGDN